MGSRLSNSGGGSATTDASLLVTGTLPLARLSGITTTQLDAAAGITSGQIASLAASKLTGSTTLPDGVLSTNVPLLNAANTFTAAQTIAASVAGPLAQVNNSSTTGAGVVIGSTTVASAGAGIIAPALALTQAAPATTRYGLLSLGPGPWDGSTTGFFSGNAQGTYVALSIPSAFTGDIINIKRAGLSTSLLTFDYNGNLTLNFNALTTNALVVKNGTSPGIYETSQNCPYLTFSSNALTVNSRTAGNVGLTIKGSASQTADLLQAQNSAAAVQFAVTNRGSGASPIWALKVRAVANAESMAQAHTIGAATGKAIEVMDDAGASLGWLALYA